MVPLPDVETVLAQLTRMGISVPAPTAGRMTVDAYGDSPELSESLLAQIRSGKKRAGTSLLLTMEAEKDTVPQVGDIALVVNHLNQPALICRNTQVDTVPYNQVTAQYAAIEGEGDGSLAYWREAHWDFFTRECQRIGREPVETMPVVCTVFELLTVVRDCERLSNATL